jgi:hypothetical protein
MWTFIGETELILSDVKFYQIFIVLADPKSRGCWKTAILTKMKPVFLAFALICKTYCHGIG